MKQTFFLLIGLTTASLLTSLHAQVANSESVSTPNVVNTNLDSLSSQVTSPNGGESELVPDTIIAENTQLFADIPDSVFIQRLSEIVSPITFPYNDKVRAYIELYTQRKRDMVERMVGASEYYFPAFETALDAYNLPLELKYMAIIESALNPVARSRVGASGIWQFMYYTGKLYGLEINSYVDERFDPIKETDAAARFLRDLYAIYGDWHLVIAAYNCGPGNINKAIKRSGGKRTFWEIYNYLPKETRNYVPAFIAAAYTMNFYKEHNLLARPTLLPETADTIMVNKMLHFQQVSSVLGLSVDQIRELNPQYRKDVIPGGKKSYALRLPAAHTILFAENEDSIFSVNRDKYFAQNQLVINPVTSNYEPEIPRDKAKIYYTVKSGDTPGFIADWFDVNVTDLKYWNDIHRNMIRVGQRMTIYVSKNKVDYYQKINTLSFADKQAMAGKTVTVSTTQSTTSTTANTTLTATSDLSEEAFIYYTVRNGDNLWTIAKKFPGVTNTDIMALNNITDARKISIGQKLKIKKKS